MAAVAQKSGASALLGSARFPGVAPVLALGALAAALLAAFVWGALPAAFEEVAVMLVMAPLAIMGLRRGPGPEGHGAKGAKRVREAKKAGDCADDVREEAGIGAALRGRLRAAARAGDAGAVEAADRELRRAGVEPSAACVGSVVGALAKAGDVDGAERWLRRLTDHPELGRPNCICFNVLISALSKAGEKCEDCDGWGFVNADSSDEEDGEGSGPDKQCHRMECPACQGGGIILGGRARTTQRKTMKTTSSGGSAG